MDEQCAPDEQHDSGTSMPDSAQREPMPQVSQRPTALVRSSRPGTIRCAQASRPISAAKARRPAPWHRVRAQPDEVQAGDQHHPQEVGVALNDLTWIEHQSVPRDQILGVPRRCTRRQGPWLGRPAVPSGHYDDAQKGEPAELGT